MCYAMRKVAKLALPRFTFSRGAPYRSRSRSRIRRRCRRRRRRRRTIRLAGRQAGWQAGWLAVCAPSPSVSHKIINLAMFSRTFECGFRLETRLRARIPRNVRKRVQPYLRRAAVCLHPSDSDTPLHSNQNGKSGDVNVRRTSRSDVRGDNSRYRVYTSHS